MIYIIVYIIIIVEDTIEPFTRRVTVLFRKMMKIYLSSYIVFKNIS